MISDNNSGMVMPVSPMYGGYNNGGFGGFGSDGWETNNLPSLNRGIKREG
jgi:hypothetical protein